MAEEQVKSKENKTADAHAEALEEEVSEEALNELRLIRRDKLKKLCEAGRDPFVQERWDVNAFSEDVKEAFCEDEEREVSMAGRIMAFRHMGKASFVDIQDYKGRIQLYVRQDVLTPEEYEVFLTYDIGDIVGVEGSVFKTRHGEISIRATRIVLLTKSLQILPNKRQGLKDPELRYRQRYVDLIMNPEVKETFIKRNKIIKAIKNYLEEEEGFLEVDTPVLTVIAGGANARPFVTYHNTLDLEMRLRISNELFLKRLTVAGLDRVYEMGKMFRNEGMDRNHSPEYTSMELYQAYGDMEDVMRHTENIVARAAVAATGSTTITYQGSTFDLAPPWERISMQEAVKKWVGVDFDEIETDAQAIAVAKKYEIEDCEKMTRGKVIAELFEMFCEDYLTGPIFLTGHPVEISPLAKRDPADPRITRRFEAYINTWEIANGFSELNDPIDQYQRFKAQQAQLESGDAEAHPMDEDFINALEVGLPPTGGLGVGIDRVVILLTDSQSIRDVILFPTMKPT
ncbi:MAG: lysine--tRNA ligase [Clostridiales Family XIII bacterium]|jgi:lysyl-tRNA synthetase class 2|nr:lysine--tRNA ligase [Clostridiales Family XIII bacterium]